VAIEVLNERSFEIFAECKGDIEKGSDRGW
jgi:hypothetical protein